MARSASAIRISIGLTRMIRMMEKKAPTKGKPLLHLSLDAASLCFLCNRMAEMQVARYVNPSKKTAEFIKAAIPPNIETIKAVTHRIVRP